MSKVGISIRVDVSKIDKARLYKGEKGTYLDLTAFVDLDEHDQYGNNGLIKQSTSKEERDSGVDLPILGNSKVFFKSDGSFQKQAPQQAPSQNFQQPPSQPQGGGMDGMTDDDIPF